MLTEIIKLNHASERLTLWQMWIDGNSILPSSNGESETS